MPLATKSQIISLYRLFLKRTPSTAEIRYQLRAKVTVPGMRAAILASPEYITRHPSANLWDMPFPANLIPKDGEYGNDAPFRSHPHLGEDAAVKVGTPIAAMAWGRVYAKGKSRELGNYIVVKASNGLYYSYSHLRNTPVIRIGAVVEKGQHIATSGATGIVTGPHCHTALGHSPAIGIDTIDPRKYCDSH